MRALVLAAALAALTACAADAPEREDAAQGSSTAAQSSTPKAEVAVLPGTEDRAGWRALLGWGEDCEERRRATAAAEMGAGIEVDTLGEGRYLVQVLCYPGAYQPGKLVFVQGPGRASAPLRLPGDDEGGSPEDSIPYVNGLTEFDRATRELEVLSKSRGMGDCGKLVRFAFPGGVPTVKWQRGQECGDAEPPIMEPHQWPLIPAGSAARAQEPERIAAD
jgi:hypothetical protein